MGKLCLPDFSADILNKAKNPLYPDSTIAASPARTASRPAPSRTAPSPVPPPASVSDGWDNEASPAGTARSSIADEPKASPAVSLAGLSKEEKEKEMARRREERKAVSEASRRRCHDSMTHPFKVSRHQRIAAMKEQKKGKA
jgi:SCY1-like protein 1